MGGRNAGWLGGSGLVEGVLTLLLREGQSYMRWTCLAYRSMYRHLSCLDINARW